MRKSKSLHNYSDFAKNKAKCFRGNRMPDYREMYLKLFRACTRALDELQKAQLETEKMFIEAGETELELLKQPEKPENAE